MHRLPLAPTLPRPPARFSFPVVAVVAPLAGALVIGLVTGSPFVLLFALLSPIIAVATALDARRGARRAWRDEESRFARECAAFDAAIDLAHRAERSAADARHPLLATRSHAAEMPLRLGVAPGLSAVAPDEVLLPGNSPAESRLRELLARARRHPALPVLVPRGAIAVRGEGAVAQALIRRLEYEAGVTVVRVASAEQSPRDVVEVRVHSATRIDVIVPGAERVSVRPEFVSQRELAERLAEAHRDTPRAIPTAVMWGDLGADGAGQLERAGAGLAIGRDGDGVVRLDLEREGPHALVGGTTGSGKSEFLRAFALAWAAERSPSEVNLLFVDFKGGATFAGLTELPHVVGLVTDLDPLVAERALVSLRAELRRRERVLVDAGLRDIAQRPGVLSRLVVLVDEFAALLDAFPELHAPFADLSARGRSLGVHLVLCTQNPAAVVRDAIVANCAVRVAFRLTPAAGSAFIGTSGRALAGAGPGRAVICVDEAERSVQIAAVHDDDIASVRRRWRDHDPAPSVWADPLPSRLENGELAAHEREHSGPLDSNQRDTESPSIVFGLLDDPAEQRRSLAVWRCDRDGSLAVIGGPRSGRSSALAALGEAATRGGAPLIVLPPELPPAWALLERLAVTPVDGALLLADDLNLLLASATERSPELGPELLARWDSAVRAQRRVGGAVAASVGAASAARALLTGRFESRLVLRAVDADDHVLAGAPRNLFDRAAPPGRGWWADRQVQVVAPIRDSLDPAPFPAAPWHPPTDRDVVIVARRPSAVAAELHSAYPDVSIELDLAAQQVTATAASVVTLTPRFLIGDPETWQAAWSLFSVARATSPLVVVGAEAADLRALLGYRLTPPPLDAGAGEVWVVEPGEPLERRRWAELAAG